MSCLMLPEMLIASEGRPGQVLFWAQPCNDRHCGAASAPRAGLAGSSAIEGTAVIRRLGRVRLFRTHSGHQLRSAALWAMSICFSPKVARNLTVQKHECPAMSRAFSLGQRSGRKAEDQCARGSGRTWNLTTLGRVPLPVSMWNGVRFPLVVHRPRPFQPAFGSSMRPSIHLA